jgi:phosphinothricin acetyltransferase
LRSFYGRPAYQNTVEIGIYIDEKYRKLGIGEEMLLHVQAAAKQIGIETILAFIFATNEGSVRFFKKHGYVQYGLLPEVAEIDSQKIDLMILGLKL